MDRNKDGLIVFDFDGTIIRFDGLRLIMLLVGIASPFRLIYLCYRCWMNNVIEQNGTLSAYMIPRLVKGKKEKAIYNFLALYRWMCRMFPNEGVKAVLTRAINSGNPVLIATASPVFAVAGLKLGIPIVGFDLDKKGGRFTGTISSQQPWGKEKLIQVKKYAEERGFCISQAYSDSISDYDLLDEAKEAFFVRQNGTIEQWKHRNNNTGA